MRAYFDADVLIWHLRGQPKAKGFFSQFIGMSEYQLWIGALQRGEIVFFMRENEEQATTSFLSQFQCASVDQDIVDLAGKLYRKWHSSHGIDVNDAILAATVKITGGKFIP